MIKFWAFIYRATGWYSTWAHIAEYWMLREYIESGDLTDDIVTALDSKEPVVDLRFLVDGIVTGKQMPKT